MGNKIIANQFDALVEYIRLFNKFDIKHKYLIENENKSSMFEILVGSYPKGIIKFNDDKVHKTISENVEYIAIQNNIIKRNLIEFSNNDLEISKFLDYAFISIYKFLIINNLSYDIVKLSNYKGLNLANKEINKDKFLFKCGIGFSTDLLMKFRITIGVFENGEKIIQLDKITKGSNSERKFILIKSVFVNSPIENDYCDSNETIENCDKFFKFLNKFFIKKKGELTYDIL